MESPSRTRRIQEHLDAIRELQMEEAAARGQTSEAAIHWPPKGYYWLFHILIGMMLGMIGATVSLLANVLGSWLLVPEQHPLQLIRVYLTFPMGEAALTEDSTKVLFIGCILYLVTGGLYGIAFHLLMSGFFSKSPFVVRFVIASLIGLALWGINFYGILSWLQPALLGGEWILTEVPAWVAAVTHLIFAWTMLMVEGWWGDFEPISRPPGLGPGAEESATA